MCLQCVTVSALEDTSEEKSWEEIYQEVYESQTKGGDFDEPKAD